MRAALRDEPVAGNDSIERRLQWHGLKHITRRPPLYSTECDTIIELAFAFWVYGALASDGRIDMSALAELRPDVDDPDALQVFETVFAPYVADVREHRTGLAYARDALKLATTHFALEHGRPMTQTPVDGAADLDALGGIFAKSRLFDGTKYAAVAEQCAIIVDDAYLVLTTSEYKVPTGVCNRAYAGARKIRPRITITRFGFWNARFGEYALAPYVAAAP